MKFAHTHRMVRDIAVISMDLAGHVTVFNHVAEKMLGYPAQDIIGKHIPIQNFETFQQDPAAYFNRPVEAQFTHANGNVVELEALLSPIQNAAGKPSGILLTAHRHVKKKEEFHLEALPDQHVLEIVLKRELNRAQREKQDLAILKMDVDHCTAYQQHYGEAKTNELLAEIGYLFEERIQRATDLLAYCGFDEFWVLLPNTDLPGCVKVAEQLRLKVMSLAWPTHVSDNDNKITISIGILHVTPTRNTTLEIVMNMADKALKEAKAQGRNCTRYQLLGGEE